MWQNDIIFTTTAMDVLTTLLYLIKQWWQCKWIIKEYVKKKKKSQTASYL